MTVEGDRGAAGLDHVLGADAVDRVPRRRVLVAVDEHVLEPVRQVEGRREGCRRAAESDCGLVIGVGLVVVTETAVEAADRAPPASTALTVKLWVEPGVRSPMCTDVIVSGTSRSREVPS